MRFYTAVLSVLAAVPAPFVSAADTPLTTLRYTGMCDASAAIALEGNQFVVANDEDNKLRVYQRDDANSTKSTKPVDELDLNKFLKIGAQNPEADIEGATMIGTRIYWITSHGANKNGKSRPNRRRLFATDIKTDGTDVKLKPVGDPFNGLVNALADVNDVAGLKDYQLAKAADLPPESADGLNIEGLTKTPEDALLIGFRNPVPKGMALLVPLENPQDVVENGKPPKLGKAMLLDLGGSGIRSIEYSDAKKTYYIVAGPFGDGGEFLLYQWSGKPGDRPEAVSGVDFQGIHPEALIVDQATKGKIQILSDDGSEKVNGGTCKDLKNPDEQGFRSVWVHLL